MDKLDAMRAFVEVVKQGSFTRAADQLNLSPQLVSKYVGQLEEKLKTRLLNRTTRKVSVTEFGRVYFSRCEQVLIDIAEMENSANEHNQRPRGVIRVSAPVSFATRHLAKALVSFQQRYPEVDVDLQLNDRKIDIVEEGFDMAFRIGRLQDSSLIAKKVAPVRLVMCASPEYLNAYGRPQCPRELDNHHYLHYSYMSLEALSLPDEFKLFANSHPRMTANNGDVLMEAAIESAGIIIQPTFIVGDALRSGELERVLPHLETNPLGLYAIYAHRQFLSAKVRALISYFSDYFGEPPYWDKGIF